MFIFLWQFYIYLILLVIIRPILTILNWKHITKMSIGLDLKNILNKIRNEYLIEKKCLLKLEKNYKCICGGYNHFPKIIKSYDIFNTFVLTYHGNSCNNIKEKIKIKNSQKQINCIMQNLKRSNILHTDTVIYSRNSLKYKTIGRNICVDKNGVISLIDFGLVKTGENIKEEEYEYLKKKIEIILKNNKFLELK